MFTLEDVLIRIKFLFKRHLTYSLGVFFLIVSCEPNAVQEAHKKKVHNDSIKADSLARINKQIKINEAKSDSIKYIKSEIEDLKANLEVENDKMARIKLYQQGRTILTREKQIQNESKMIHQMEDRISDLQLKQAAFVNSLVK